MSCYYPNGDPSIGEIDIPCNTSGDSPCCPDQWQCESNGLCFLENEGYYGRYTCTDQTWQSSSCPQICTHGMFRPVLGRTEMKLTEDVDLTANGNEAVLECTSGSYCCDSNRPELSGGTACCEAGAPKFSLAALPLLPLDGDGGNSTLSSEPTPLLTTTEEIPTLSSTVAQTSSTPPSSTPTSNTPTSTFQTSTAPLTGSTAPFTTPTSAPQTLSTSIPPTKNPSRSSLSTPGSSNPSIIVLTQTFTPTGSQSTLTSSETGNVTGSAPTSAPTKESHIGGEVGGSVGGFAFIAMAILFCYWRRRRSRRSRPAPRTLQTSFVSDDPESLAPSPFPHSPGTAPPDSHRSSTLVGMQDQHPQSAELQGSPTAGTWGGSMGLGLTRNAETGATTSPTQPGLPAMSEGRVGRTIAAELPATTSTYRPYRPPGWGRLSQ